MSSFEKFLTTDGNREKGSRRQEREWGEGNGEAVNQEPRRKRNVLYIMSRHCSYLEFLLKSLCFLLFEKSWLLHTSGRVVSLKDGTHQRGRRSFNAISSQRTMSAHVIVTRTGVVTCEKYSVKLFLLYTRRSYRSSSP